MPHDPLAIDVSTMPVSEIAYRVIRRWRAGRLPPAPERAPELDPEASDLLYMLNMMIQSRLAFEQQQARRRL